MNSIIDCGKKQLPNNNKKAIQGKMIIGSGITIRYYSICVISSQDSRPPTFCNEFCNAHKPSGVKFLISKDRPIVIFKISDNSHQSLLNFVFKEKYYPF